jgi:hypothetical protein
MIKPVSKNRSAAFLFDFQVLKGKCEKTMKAFGKPVCATHEARLLIEDDARKLSAGETALYVIHQRSENRILKIVEMPRLAVLKTPASRSNRSARFPLLQAA